MRLLLDMDGVLANLLAKWLATYNRDHDDAIGEDDLKSWGIWQWVKIGHRIFDYLHEPHWFLDLEPMPGAIDGVQSLVNSGHEIFVVTAVPLASPTGLHDKSRWLEQHFPMIPRHHLIAAQRKDLVAGDLLLDDSPEHIDAFPGITVLYDHPYNRTFKSDHRVTSWPAFVTLIDTLAATTPSHTAPLAPLVTPPRPHVKRSRS